MPKTTKKVMSWDEFDSACKYIAKEVSKYKGMVRNIYGIPRGGLMVAVRLSHLLDIPILSERSRIGWDTLIVDDYLEKGNTLHRHLKQGPYFAAAVVYVNGEKPKAPRGLVIDMVGIWKKGTVVFPWEINKK